MSSSLRSQQTKPLVRFDGGTPVADRQTGPAEPHSTTLSAEQEAIIVAFRHHTLLPLDDCLYALQPTIPQQFTTPGNKASAAPLIREAIDRGEIFRAHGFELACAQNRIEHRLTKPHHPWTNGQVERMNRTLKEATVQRYHYASVSVR